MEKGNNSQKTPELSVLVHNKEQILSAYQGLFDTVYVGWPFEIEKHFKNTHDLFRLIICPSGVVAISSKERNRIWNMNFESDEGKSLLEQSSMLLAEANPNDITDLIRELIIEDNTYYLRMLPYDDQKASDVLVYELDQKYMASKLE